MPKPTRFLSVNEFCKIYGVPIQFTRKEIEKGIVPGFYSGKWFYVDSEAYLENLSSRNQKERTAMRGGA